MEWRAKVKVVLKKGILDPQGKAIEAGLRRLGYKEITGLSYGKFMEIRLVADTEDDARRLVVEACERLLANPVIEDYEAEIMPA
ncbi:MAG TPA: phosphoribosylformylglycinamidine synthase subunit PurS [Firmicutes bacterium]|nr:phosphoribosylformylglycinamidine synthase subunit PurS [Bacillota bacterium]HHY97834.1 phosphoribosylformylglycinamidine synthase subunit PurS [Bacillota bacterium]